MTRRAINGRYRRIGERERRTPPLLVVTVPSKRSLGVSRGNVKRAAKAKARVFEVASLLRNELVIF